MHSVDKVRFVLFYGEVPEAACYGYMELDQGGDMVALYNGYGEEIDRLGGHEMVRVRALGDTNETAIPRDGCSSIFVSLVPKAHCAQRMRLDG